MPLAIINRRTFNDSGTAASAPAEAAAVAVSAFDVSAAIRPAALEATATAAAFNPGPSVAPGAGVAAVTAAANNPTADNGAELRGWQLTSSNIGRAGAGYTGTTVYSGSSSLSSGTHLIEDKRITSPITVSGTAQVTIRGCKIDPSSTTAGSNFIQCDSGTPTLVVEDCDIDGVNVAGGLGGVAYMFAISSKAGTVTVRRNWVRRVGRAFIFAGSPTLVYEQNRVEELVSFGNPATTGSHNECFQTFEGFSGTIEITDNWLDGDTANATAAVTLQGTVAGGSVKCTIEGNYLNGGGYALVQDGNWGSGTLVINDNRWGPDGFFGTISIEDTGCSSGSGNFLYNASNPPTYAGSAVNIP